MCNTHTISHVKLWTSPFRFPFSQSPHPAPVWSLVSSCRPTWWRRPLYCVRSFTVVFLLDEAEVKPQKRFPVSCTFYSWQKRSGRRNIPYEGDPSYQLLNFRSYSWKSKFHPTILFLRGGCQLSWQYCHFLVLTSNLIKKIPNKIMYFLAIYYLAQDCRCWDFWI